MRRVIGMDIHRTFAEVVFWEEGRLRPAGRVSMTRSGLEGFGRGLGKEDEVVIEATGNAMAVVRTLSPYVARVIVANTLQVKAIAHAHVKTDKIDAGVLASLRAADFLPEVWLPDPDTERLRRLVARRNQVVRHRTRIKNEVHAVLHAHLIPPCPQKLVSYDGLNPRVRQSGLGLAQHGRISKRGRSHARAMLVEAAWAAAKAPGPLRAFFLRIRARRGHQIAAVAVARKLAVLCWHLLTKSADYQWARPALVASKLRAMELQAGQPVRKGNKRGTAYAYNVKALRDAEIELARHAEKAYERFVSQWQRRGTAKQRTGAAIEERR